MVRGKNFGRGAHLRMSIEESANVTRERSVFGLPGRIQRSRCLLICMAYLLPARFAFGDKGWKLGLAARNGDGLFVGASVRLGHRATCPARQACAEFDERHA